MEFLIHTKPIFGLSGFFPGGEEIRDNHSLLVNLTLAELGPSFGSLKSRYEHSMFHGALRLHRHLVAPYSRTAS